MNNNYKELMLCSMDKLLDNYINKGYGRSKSIMLISIVNKVLSNIDFMLNDAHKTKLNNIITIIGNSDKDMCIYDTPLDYIYEDGCMNPTYESNVPYNRIPTVSDVTIIL